MAVKGSPKVSKFPILGSLLLHFSFSGPLLYFENFEFLPFPPSSLVGNKNLDKLFDHSCKQTENVSFSCTKNWGKLENWERAKGSGMALSNEMTRPCCSQTVAKVIGCSSNSLN